MENLLYEYMSKRFNAEHELHDPLKGFGPVITISRQAGCGASKIAHDICQLLNTNPFLKGKPIPWQFINHEILEKSAEKLDLDPRKLNRVITDKERGIMDQIVEAMSGHAHKSDQKIMKTLQDVIRQFAEHGNVVIVGRGGAAVSQHIAKSLHVRLEAPFDWRVEKVMKKLEYSREYATQYIKRLDGEREMYVHRMLQDPKHYSIYDVILNPSRFTEKQMVDIIIQVAVAKGL
ncbi:MAG: cytidylate kinase-like family protein [Bacteroidetes bacterium]|nr:cytidylate kinase-like family protein [Bacteroidota bacterium]